MNRGDRWIPCVLLAPIWLAACDKANEPAPGKSQPGSQAEALLVYSYDLAGVAGMDMASLDNSGFETCTENSELFTGCEAPGAQTSAAEAPPDAATPLETPSAATINRSVLLATVDPSTDYTPRGESAIEASSVRAIPGSTDRCGQVEPPAPTPKLADPAETATDTDCPCGTKQCMCG